ncbi:hypothetical protein ACYT84_02585 [Ralstonia solanacearum]|uniref:hypothetical protein n=1 Tax=Ralstonia solanacearum TaxID=305 RepID=UPI001E4880A6|nr:hypothetical protein [Ralstonia solanacearum]
MLRDLRRSYQNVGNIFGRYWNAYGRWVAILTSPYLHVSIVLTVILSHLWIRGGWWSDAIAALPTMIGFAIGAYAIVLGFGDERFRAVIMLRRNGDTSPYVKISASLAHFIVVQIAALLAAFIGKGLNFGLNTRKGLGALIFAAVGNIDFVHDWIAPSGNFIGFVLFIYAIATAMATAMAIFRLTTLVERDEPPSNGGASDRH